MPIGYIFWLFMIIWFVFGLWTFDRSRLGLAGNHLILFILIAILGWKVFGSVVK